MTLARWALTVVLFAGLAGSVGVADAETPALSVSVAPVAFGVYDPNDPQGLSSTGFIEVRSSFASAYRVLLGSGSAGNYRSRKLSGREQLDYNLFADPAMQQVWGDGSGGTVTGAPNLKAADGVGRMTVYGFLAPGQRVASGVYTDTIVVTIEF